MEFHESVRQEIESAVQVQRPLRNLYGLETPDEQSVEAKVREALAAPTSEEDTHPGPNDRFRLVHRIPAPAGVPVEGVLWDLFPDTANLTDQMSAAIQARLA